MQVLLSRILRRAARVDHALAWCGRKLAGTLLTVFVALLLAATPAQRADAAEPHRYALSMFHFNIQYVAGGLEGFVPGLPADSPQVRNWEIDDEMVEDHIITESFEPVLDLYLAHPTWGVDIELQGYFLDVLAARHPTVLAKLRSLAVSGQAEVVSFHYSDQLFLAFPREDWERSQTLTRQTFERNGIPLATTVFAQEGQAGTGMPRAMAERGYRVLVWPKNLFSFQHGAFDAAPYYSLGGVDMIAGAQGVRSVAGDVEIDVDWTFFDDGEKLATGDADPYFTPIFIHKPPAVARYEKEVAGLEAQGYSISTIGRYVSEVRGLGVEPAQAPPLLDGTWQPNSTDGMRKWLGGAGIWDAERDNDVRSVQALAHREIVAAETAAHASAIDRSPLDDAWRLLALSEVSDSTGINPFRGEVEYGIGDATEALRIATEAIDQAKASLGAQTVQIDVAQGSVQVEPPVPEGGGEIAPPLQVRVDAGGRTWRQSWTGAAAGVARLELQFDPGSAAPSRKLAVTFPGDSTEIVYCPALDDDRPVSIPKSSFTFDHYQMALANGLIGLSAQRFVVKETARVHLAATVTPTDGDVTFSDDTAPTQDRLTWVFHVVDGTLDDAVGYANRLNVSPTVIR
ncbi:MAG: hypothetical protein HY270_20340 [Deltaproteobacteria bacterium]|nr:hypothetical protein [Deltaproteobacteria bacterium]